MSSGLFWWLLETEPVRPANSQGFAAAVLAAFVVLGLLALIMVFVSSKPRNRRRAPND